MGRLTGGASRLFHVSVPDKTESGTLRGDGRRGANES